MQQHGFGYIRAPRTQSEPMWQSYGAPLLPQRLSRESVVGPVFDQGTTEQCVAYSIGGAVRWAEYLKSGSYIQPDFGAFYAECKAVDGINGPGTIPAIACQVLVDKGYPDQAGQFHKAASFARLATIDDVREALCTGPVILAVRINTQDLGQLAKGAFAEIEQSPGEGHCMLAVGYDDVLQILRVRNSWGDLWNDDGHFDLPYAYLTTSDPEFDAFSVAIL